MFRPTDPLLLPDYEARSADDCDDRQLLNPGRLVTAWPPDSVDPADEDRALLALVA